MSALLLSLVLAAGGNPFLQEAKVHLQALAFERCLERLAQASTQWKSTPDELREIELTLGLCHFNLGHRKLAAEHFRTALRIDEASDLPPYTSPKAVDLFLAVKKALRAPTEPMPDEDLPADAPVERSLVPRPPPTPLTAPLDPWPRRVAPLTLTGVTLVAAGTAIGLGVSASAQAAKANSSQYESDFVTLGAAARGTATGANVAWGVAGAAAVSAVITWILVEREPHP
jgi:hypothetical protein